MPVFFFLQPLIHIMEVETSRNKSCFCFVLKNVQTKLQKFIHSIIIYCVFWISISYITQLLTLKFIAALDLTVVRICFGQFIWFEQQKRILFMCIFKPIEIILMNNNVIIRMKIITKSTEWCTAVQGNWRSGRERERERGKDTDKLEYVVFIWTRFRFAINNTFFFSRVCRQHHIVWHIGIATKESD